MLLLLLLCRGIAVLIALALVLAPLAVALLPVAVEVAATRAAASPLAVNGALLLIVMGVVRRGRRWRGRQRFASPPPTLPLPWRGRLRRRSTGGGCLAAASSSSSTPPHDLSVLQRQWGEGGPRLLQSATHTAQLCPRRRTMAAAREPPSKVPKICCRGKGGADRRCDCARDASAHRQGR